MGPRSMSRKRPLGRYWHEQERVVRHYMFSGHAGNLKGQRAEEAVDAASQEIVKSGWPMWVKSSRRATKEEDHQGIDQVFETDVGKLLIQVKAGRAEALKFRRACKGGKYNGRPIEVVVADKLHRKEGLKGKIVYKLALLRNRILEERNK
jgi:hypothetical protein